jgi:hypothetical protein
MAHDKAHSSLLDFDMIDDSRQRVLQPQIGQPSTTIDSIPVSVSYGAAAFNGLTLTGLSLKGHDPLVDQTIPKVRFVEQLQSYNVAQSQLPIQQEAQKRNVHKDRALTAGSEVYFLKSISIAEKSPLWDHISFRDVFADGLCSPRGQAESSHNYVVRAGQCFRILSRILRTELSHARRYDQRDDSMMAVMNHAVTVFDDAYSLCEQLPYREGDATKSFVFLSTFMTRLRSLRLGESVIAPCGWYTPVSSDSGTAAVGSGIIIVATRTDQDTDNDYSIAVINTSGANGSLEYHASSVDPSTGHSLRNISFQLSNVPSRKVINTSFW